LDPADRPTERLDGSTKVIRDGSTRLLEHDELSPESRNRVLLGLGSVQIALNGAIGALLALIVYGLTDGMPVWIAGALAVALAAGGGLGAWLAPHIRRWIGLPTALIGTALLMGESLVAAGTWGSPESPVPAVVLAGLSFVSFAAWHRLAALTRERVVPTELRGRVTAVNRATGFASILLGGAAAAGFFLLRGV
jgi:hypothetical protein